MRLPLRPPLLLRLRSLLLEGVVIPGASARDDMLDGEELFFIPGYDPDKVILYAPLRGAAMLLNAVAAREISSRLAGGTAPLSTTAAEVAHFLKRNEPIPMGRGRYTGFAPTHVSLALSLGCNLRCSYCHATAGQATLVMGERLARAGIDFAFANASARDEDFLLSFAGGGEPTHEWDLFVQLVEYFHALPALPRAPKYLTMATNACFPERKAEYIADRFSGVSVSIDGPESIHDGQRCYPSGRGTFSTVIASARIFKERGLPFSVRATVTDQSVHRMTEIVEFFHETFPGVTIALEPMVPFGRGKTSTVRPPDPKEYVRAFKETLTRAEQLGACVINSGTVKLDTLRSTFCKSIAMPGLVVTPDGRVAACERDNVPEEFYYGRYDSETGTFEVDLAKIERLRRHNAFDLRECRNCFCRWNCAGDCQHLRLEGMSRCEANREMIRFVLHQRLNGSVSAKRCHPPHSN